MAFLDDKILLKENNVYRFASLEKTSKVLQRIALESYIDTYEVDRVSTYTLNCDRCGGNFMLQNNGGYTVLSCPTCHNTKHIGKNEALLLKDLYKIKCPDCNADVIPRTKNGHSNYSFYGCSNYPHCMGQVPMYSIAKGY
jgi:ssDNA-binding Zn-finger/Zn-ribbon topoisomerase 1